MERHATQAGYATILQYPAPREGNGVRPHAARGRVDGMIFISSEPDLRSDHRHYTRLREERPGSSS
jgi:hypothetical protein